MIAGRPARRARPVRRDRERHDDGEEQGQQGAKDRIGPALRSDEGDPVEAAEFGQDRPDVEGKILGPGSATGAHLYSTRSGK
ncbi:MAG: hypothetical protein HY720_25995 [Planctomycetes bacterium]|nr:hypothetical protein [Planctomycetota bacterium]